MQAPNNIKQRAEHPGGVTPCPLTWECRHHKDHEQRAECFLSVTTPNFLLCRVVLIITWAKWLTTALGGSFICHSHWSLPGVPCHDRHLTLTWCIPCHIPELFSRVISYMEMRLLGILWLCSWDRVYESARSSPDIFPLVQNWVWSSVAVSILDTLSSSFFFTFGLWVALWPALLCLPEPTFLRKEILQETASRFCNVILIN